MGKDKPAAPALDKNALLKDAPALARPVLGGVIDWLNKLDLNHDGVSDLVQLAPVAAKVLPLALKLYKAIDWEKLLAAYCKNGVDAKVVIAEIKEAQKSIT